MSQFGLAGGSFGAPGQDIERGAFAGREKRLPAGITHSPEVGLQGSLIAPGLVTPPPEISEGVKLAGDLAASLGLAGHVANQVESYAVHDQNMADRAAYRTQAERERAERIATKAEAQAEHLDRGQASESFNTFLPKFQASLAQGKFPTAANDDMVDAQVKSFVAAASAGRSQAFADQWSKEAALHLTRAIVNHQVAQYDEARNNTVDMTRSRVASAQSPEEISAAVSSLRDLYPEVSNEKINGAVLIPALHVAAETASPARFKNIQSVLGDSDTIEQQTAKLKLDRAVDAKQRQANGDLKEFADGLQNDPAPVSLAEQESQVREKAGQIGADERGLTSALAPIKTQRKSRAAELKKQQYLQDKQDTIDGIMQDAVDKMRDARTTGGAAMLETQHVEVDGKIVPIPRDQQIAAGVAQDRASTVDNPNVPPQQAFAAHAEYLSLNGVVDPQDERVMQAGAIVPSFDLDKATKTDAPKNFMDGYGMFKKYGAINPRLRDMNLKGNPIASKLYEITELGEKYVSPGDPEQAAIQAMKASKKEAFSDPNATRTRSQDIRAEMNNISTTGHLWWSHTKNNPGEIEGEIERVADLYMQTIGLPPKIAVKEASAKVQQHFTDINDWWVPTFGKNVPQNLPDAAKIITAQYADKHGKDEGLSASDLTLQPADVDGLWILFNKRTNSYVDKWASEGRFTDSDFASLVHATGQADAAARDAKINSVAGRVVAHPREATMKTAMDFYREAAQSRVVGDALIRDGGSP